LGYQRIAKLCDLCDSPLRPLRENISSEFFLISFPQKTPEKKANEAKKKMLTKNKITNKILFKLSQRPIEHVIKKWFNQYYE